MGWPPPSPLPGPHSQAHQVQDGGQDPVHRAYLLSAEADHLHGFPHCLVVAPLLAVRGLGEKGLSTPPPPVPHFPALNAAPALLVR